MRSVYYKIWVDAILFEQGKKGKEIGWKSFTMISISILQGINLLTLLFIMRALTHRKMPILLPFKIFNASAYNTFIALFLTFIIPFLILNYLFIFYNDRYKELIQANPYHNGKWYRNYAIISVGIIVIPFICKIIF